MQHAASRSGDCWSNLGAALHCALPPDLLHAQVVAFPDCTLWERMSEIERWRVAVKNSSMAILKDVQKLLGFLKESSWSKLNGVSAEIAQHATELMDTVQDGVSSQQDAAKKVLETLKDIKASLVATMNQIEAVTGNPSDEVLQDKLRNECKTVAGLIKQIHQQVAEVTADDLTVSEVQKSVATSIPAAPLALAEWLESMAQQTKLAAQSLKALQTAACNKDQTNLVSNAKYLSGHCAELLNQARKCRLDTQGDSVKTLVLNVINVAKTVFKSGDDASAKQLEEAVASTDSGLRELLHSLEDAAGVDPARQPPTASEMTESSSSSPPSSPRSSKKEKHHADDSLTRSSSPGPASRNSATVPAQDSLSALPTTPADLLSPKDASKQLQKEFSSRDPEKVFKVQDLLGEGASGSVYKAIHRETKKVVAIKKMQVGVNNITSTVKEIKIMKDLKSPFTLKYYGCYQKDDCIWIIMEFCDGGSVQDIIDARESESTCLSEAQISQITLQVLKALEYLHSMKKIHRDIKAGNILINGRGMAKLADFGISAQQVGDEKRTTTIGSSYWMAPETLMGGGYDSKADIWSLGITVMEMAEGIPPLIEEQPHKAAFRIVNDPPPKLSNPDQWTPIFNDFLAKCLVKNPDKRPTASELLQHPFVKQAEDQHNAAIVELLGWVEKHKKKKKKSSLKETILGSKQDVEEEANIDVYFEADTASDQKINLLVPAHATVEDVLRQCVEQFKTARDVKDYSLYLVVEEIPGKQKEKQLGMFDLPVKIYSHASKKYKKKDKTARDPVRFIFK